MRGPQTPARGYREVAPAGKGVTEPMPLYDYRCVDCGAQEHRIAGLDDHTALCVECGGLMLRIDDDLFTPLFKDFPDQVRSGYERLSNEVEEYICNYLEDLKAKLISAHERRCVELTICAIKRLQANPMALAWWFPEWTPQKGEFVS